MIRIPGKQIMVLALSFLTIINATSCVPTNFYSIPIPPFAGEPIPVFILADVDSLKESVIVELVRNPDTYSRFATRDPDLAAMNLY